MKHSARWTTHTVPRAYVSLQYALHDILEAYDVKGWADLYSGFEQVNQKMMKSALIKDLYGEIDRLKSGTRWTDVGF
jgi:hypothetical protein